MITPIRATEDSKFATQLNRLEQFNQFISGIATAIVAGNRDFESVWSIANRVYEQHCSARSGSSRTLAWIARETPAERIALIR